MASHFASVSGARSNANPYRVLIAGGCYGGLAVAINLLEKCDTIESPIPVEITIVDERDGFCTCNISASLHLMHASITPILSPPSIMVRLWISN